MMSKQKSQRDVDEKLRKYFVCCLVKRLTKINNMLLRVKWTLPAKCLYDVSLETGIGDKLLVINWNSWACKASCFSALLEGTNLPSQLSFRANYSAQNLHKKLLKFRVKEELKRCQRHKKWLFCKLENNSANCTGQSDSQATLNVREREKQGMKMKINYQARKKTNEEKGNVFRLVLWDPRWNKTSKNASLP